MIIEELGPAKEHVYALGLVTFGRVAGGVGLSDP
jgi:hypothetical protein